MCDLINGLKAVFIYDFAFVQYKMRDTVFLPQIQTGLGLPAN